MAIVFEIKAGQNVLGRVSAKRANFAGVWCGIDGLLTPDLDEVKALLPRRWHKAWERQSTSFWFNTKAAFGPNINLVKTPEGTLDLNDARGELMAALIATPMFGDE